MPWNYPSWGEWFKGLITLVAFMALGLGIAGLGLKDLENDGMPGALIIFAVALMIAGFATNEFLFPAGFGSDEDFG